MLNRVLYIISRENVLDPGVLKSQVFDLLGQIIKQDGSTEIIILNLPSLNSFWKRIKKIREFKAYARKLGIKVIFVPILPIGRSAMPVWAVPFFLAQAVPLVLFFVLRYRINVIHARSYLSSLVIYFLNKIGLKTKLVFDMRAPYLLEGIINRRWSESDFNYRFWEKLERKMFQFAGAVVAQATGMVDYVQGVSPSARVVYIPNCVNPNPYRTTVGGREAERKRLGISNQFVLVYSGSFGGLHPPRYIAGLYARFRENLLNPYLLVFTHSDPREITEKLIGFGVPKSEFTILRNPNNLEQLITLGDAGIASMGGEILTTPLVLSVKVPEYLAAGLPLIVSPEMASVAKLVREENCGVVVNHLDQNDIRVKMQKLVKEQGTMRKNALWLAQGQFSAEVCAKRYLEIYDEIASKNKP